ncbi:hypothetical protein E2P81_ATG06247 [Venturia nashicola]|nr:hypothetical protein E2P81_ATG06247 [Venturia nashicola]
MRHTCNDLSWFRSSIHPEIRPHLFVQDKNVILNIRKGIDIHIKVQMCTDLGEVLICSLVNCLVDLDGEDSTNAGSDESRTIVAGRLSIPFPDFRDACAAQDWDVAQVVGMTRARDSTSFASDRGITTSVVFVLCVSPE